MIPKDYRLMTQPQRRKLREEYVDEQKGLCYHCGEPLSGKAAKEVRKLPINKRLFPNGFFKYPVHLHHDHNTGLTIGAVHNYCNAVLWQYYGE